MKLEEYLKQEDLHVAQFGRKIGLSHTTMYNLLKGRDCRGSIFAKIHYYTKGKVSLKDFYPPEKDQSENLD